MKEFINVNEWARHIMEALPRGILLNTQDAKFNAMVIGWGHLGVVWSRPTFITYVRESRFTKAQLDRTREFTVSAPLEGVLPEIQRVCGTLSGRDVDKVKEAGLTLVPAEVISTPGVAEYPLTLECRVLYAQRQALELLPGDIRERMYPQDVDGSNPSANRDPHTAYIGEIVSAYIIR